MSRAKTLRILLSLVPLTLACDLRVVDSLPSSPRDVPIQRPSSLLLHSTMDSAQEIFAPVVATTTYSLIQDAIPGPNHVSYEPGKYVYAARFDATGFNGPTAGPLRFHGDNFDFDDADNNGGRLDFWIKFNVDPHGTYANTWVARSNYGVIHYNINYEFATGNPNTPANLMVDVYSDILHNERTNYRNFRVMPRLFPVYQNIRQGEWHLITLTWRRNGGPHKAELHIYIDGTQEGCLECNDYNGNLPPEGSVWPGTTELFFAPPLYDDVILFSIDDIYSFDSWDVSGITGNFANLQIPEGVTLTYPMDERFPVYGSPVPNTNIVFEFAAVDHTQNQCACDLYVDNALVNSVVTTSQAHTEIANPNALAEGTHTFQVKCNDNRLVSAVTQFTVALP